MKMGPLVSQAQLAKVESYVKIGIGEGAELLCGGKRPQGAEFAKGWFFEPTIFDSVKPSMRMPGRKSSDPCYR